MADLTTQDYCLSRIPGLTAGQMAALPGLIAAASRLIERYCGRRFSLAAHEEVLTPSSAGAISLRAYPVVSLDRIFGGWVKALAVTNESASVTRASVRLGVRQAPEDFPAPADDSVQLSRWEAGSEVVELIAFADQLTITDMAAAITGLGSGWSAVAEAGYGDWPSSDLWMRTPLGAKGPAVATLQVPGSEFSAWDLQADCGLVRGLRCCKPLRVRYRAGYATIPADLQEACCLAVAGLLGGPDSTLMAGLGIVSRKLGDREIQFANPGVGLSTGVRPSWLSPQVATILAAYRKTTLLAV